MKEFIAKGKILDLGVQEEMNENKMTLDEALKEIEILKIQNNTLSAEVKSLRKKRNSLKLELKLARARYYEKCAEFNRLYIDYLKMQVKNKRLVEEVK